MVGITLCLLLAFSYTHGLGPLNELIQRYEVLDYRPVTYSGLTASHSTPDNVLLEFSAFGRQMKIILQRDRLTLGSATLVVDGNDGRLHSARPLLVIGKINNEKGSKVDGSLTENGLFIGRIYSPKYGLYFVEPAEMYFKKPTRFHSVIYRSEDVYDVYPETHHSEGHTRVHTKTHHPNGFIRRPIKTHHSDGHTKTHHPDRHRRSSSNYEWNICRLSVEADHKFCNMAGGTSQTVHMLVNHVKALNAIYQRNFNTTKLYAPYGIQFQIGRIKIYVNKNETAKVLGSTDHDSDSFLDNIISNGNYRNYCQVIFFTHQPFERGVLGKTYYGGACTELNPVLVTSQRGNMRLPAVITEIVLAHEIAHGFNAKEIRNCKSVTRKRGAYIMQSACGHTGMQKKNHLFSSDTLDLMSEFIDSKRSHRTGNHVCFETYEELNKRFGLCGNGMVDDDEECDCGNEYTCKDMDRGNCCDYKTCKLNKQSECSPSNGLCCNGSTCTFEKAGEVCMKPQECLRGSICAGNSSLCPDPLPKEYLVECNQNSSVCSNGTCSLSICEKYGMRGCFCKEEDEQCKICCYHDKKCQAAEKIEKIKSKIKQTHLMPGLLCDDNAGYCDMFHHCHQIDNVGPIRRLYRVLAANARKGVKEVTNRFWWAILLGTCGLIGCIFLVVKYGALYTRSSNPLINEAQPARKMTCRRSTKENEEQDDILAMEDISSSHPSTFS